MRQAAYTGQFKRDVKLAQRRGKELAKLERPMRLLIEELPLDKAYLDHPRKGDWKGFRDLHIEPDWLLIYRVEQGTVRFERTGRHVDLFDAS